METTNFKTQTIKPRISGYNLTLSVNNFHLSYDDIGEGGIPIIFLHGFPFSKAMWHDQLEFLKLTNRVIACDIRGFGQSKDEETHLSIDLFAEDLIKFMYKLNIDKAVICGLSMGGFIALNAMKRNPARFKALILCDTQCIDDSIEVKEKRLKTIEQILSEGSEMFNETFTKSVFSEESLLTKTGIVENLKTVVSSNSQHIITSGITALAERSETCCSLSSISVPTLIICGKEDTLTPLAQSEFMHKKIKDSNLKVIEHVGHVSNLEAPEVFNKHLHYFLTVLKRCTEGVQKNRKIKMLK